MEIPYGADKIVVEPIAGEFDVSVQVVVEDSDDDPPVLLLTADEARALARLLHAAANAKP